MAKSNRPNVYERVTAKILAQLAEGTVPWHKPWAEQFLPMSMSSGKPYRGVNVWMLDGGFWGTFNRIKEEGGMVRKGEKSSLAVFWKFIDSVDEKTGETKKVPLLRGFNVFHTSQADWPDGLPEKFQPAKGGATEADRIAAAEQIITDYRKSEGAPRFSEGGDRACYYPQRDEIVVPDLTAFHDIGSRYSTMFHEMGHSTGAASRLNREGVTNFDAFGSHQYGIEELVAEMTAAMLCGVAGVEGTFEASASYIDSWMRRIKEDDRMVVKAAGQAQKAADLILGVKWEKPEED